MQSPAPFGAAAPLDFENYNDPAYGSARPLTGEPAQAPAGKLTHAKRPATAAVRWRAGQTSIPPGASIELGSVDDTAVNRRVVRVLANPTPGYVRIGHTDQAAQMGYELDAATVDDHGAATEIRAAGPLFAFNTHATAYQTLAWVIEYVASTTGPVTDLYPDRTIETLTAGFDAVTDKLGALIGLLVPPTFDGDNDG